MSGFDEARVELKKLEKQHQELSVEVPKMQAEKEALYESLMELNRDVTEAEQQLAQVKENTAEIMLKHTTEVNDKTGELNDLQIKIETYKKAVDKDYDDKKRELKAREDEIIADRNKLDTLLERHVSDQKYLEEEVGNFHKIMVAHDKELKDFRKEKEEFEETKKQMQKDFGKDTIKAIQDTIERDRQEVVDMTKEAEAKLKKGSVEEAKASGLVARLIAKHGVRGLSVAPPA